MLMHTGHRRSTGREGAEPAAADRAGRSVALGLIAAPASGLAIAAYVVDKAADLTATTWMVSSTIAVVALLAGLVVAIRSAIASTRSPTRPVFPFRQASVWGCWLAVLAFVLTTALVFGDPFGHVSRNFRFGASDVVDLGLLAAIIVLSVAGGAMLLDAWDFRRAERSWPDHL